MKMGSEAWWQAKMQAGVPEIAAVEAERCRTVFYWRDPEGDEHSSTTRRVWLNIAGITDHHRQQRPFSLHRVSGTDIWQGEVMLSSGWRGSYCLIPSVDDGDFPADHLAADQLRSWWKRHLPAAIADPLNPLRSWRNARGHAVSPLHMPAAPPQPAWQPLDRGLDAAGPPLATRLWYSSRLANRRSVWLLETGESRTAPRPLAIVLDGQFWVNGMPLAAPLRWLTQRGELPPASYLFIDAIGTAQRSQELTCNPAFWLAVQEELLPQVSEWSPSWDPQLPTLVAGQSYGGLAALYAALHWPQLFNGAVSLSGSFWWPDRHSASSAGWLGDRLRQGAIASHPQRIWLEAGLHEKIILQSNRTLLPLLRASGHELHYREFQGGHDALCWRGGLTDGLHALWAGLC